MGCFTRKINGVSVSKKLLLQEYAPKYICERKKLFFDLARKVHPKPEGEMEITRWGFDENGFEDGADFFDNCEFSTVPEYYDYKKDMSSRERAVWYVNFADFLLFGFYDDNKFAQDEIQTTEHPLLGSVVRYLDDKRFPDLVTETALVRNKITAPYLVENVPYWVSINTSVKMPDGSVHNLYGRCFRNETEEVLHTGVKVVEENINDNIIAIAAPDDFYNESYSATDIRYLMETLLTSFSGACKQSREKGAGEVVIHTGNWGCGAFGGNKVLTYLSQFIAGCLCGVDQLVFHAPDEGCFQEAREMFREFKEKVVLVGEDKAKGKVGSLKVVLEFLMGKGFKWSNSDGN